MSRKKYESHPSYGMLQISKPQGGHRALFGSSVMHSSTIRMSIHPGQIARDINTDWFYAESAPFIEIELSPAQFAEAITGMNSGMGTPCTIRKIKGQDRIPDCEFTDKKMQFVQEFEQKARKIADQLNDISAGVEDMLNNKKSITKGDRKEILNMISKLRMEVGANMPFVMECFNEQVEKTITEAKSEVDAFITGKIHELGVQALQGDMPILPGTGGEQLVIEANYERVGGED